MMWGITKNVFASHLLFCNLAIFCLSQASAQNTPPQIYLDREWILTENEPVESVVTRIKVSDEDEDIVDVKIGAPSSNIHQIRNDGYSFFKIDKEHRVRLAKSLSGMAGEVFLVGLIANDGTISSRIDVKVTIKKPNQKVKATPSGFASSFDPGLPPSDLPQYSFSESNEVPLLLIDPDTIWTLSENASVGSVVLHVEASDYSHTYLKYSLHPSHLLHIDPDSGEVTVARSLLGEIGDHSITVNVSNLHNFITEKVTLRVVAHDDSSIVNNIPSEIEVITKDYSIIKEHFTHYRPKYELTTRGPPSIVIEKVTSKTVIPPAEKEVTIGWTVGLLVLLLGVLPLALVGLFFLWRWRRIQSLKSSATKELSVSYSEKRGSIDNQEQSRGRDSIVDGLFSMVGIHKRAESNGYSVDIKVPTVPTRENSKTSKSIKLSEVAEAKDEWEYARHKLRVLGKLGEGYFGQVWKYEATDIKNDGPTVVAVKTLKEGYGAEDLKDLLSELKVLKSLGYHPNVVSLLGCCTEKEPIFIILEYLVGGKLQSYLRDSRAERSYDNLHGVSGTLTPRDLTIFALQVAKGMDFLSAFGIIHRDLAARNVLIGEGKVCKVADFGFARDVAIGHEYERKSDGRLPIRWMAPESLFDNKFTTKSDVWSFGILLWEIVTLGSIPYPGLSAQDVMRRLKDGYRLEKPDHCRREIYNIMYYCWEASAKDRPSFSELVQKLNSLIQTEVEYIHLDNFPDHSYYNFNSGDATGELL